MAFRSSSLAFPFAFSLAVLNSKLILIVSAGSDSLAVGAYPVRYCLKLQQQTDDLFSKLYPYIAVQ